jgi:hypothetical protein
VSRFDRPPKRRPMRRRRHDVVHSPLLSRCGLVAAALLATSAFIPVVGASGTVTEKQFGFSFSLPSHWRQVPLDGRDVGAILKQATKADPSLASALDAQIEEATKDSLKVFAVGPVESGYLPNLTVGVLPSTGFLTASAFITVAAAEVKAFLEDAHAEHVVTSTARLALGNALEVSCAFSLKTAHEHADEVQLYVAHHADILVVTFTSTSLPEDQSVLRAVTNSWRWI